MVDPGDTVSATLKKEFGEEALNSMELSENEQEKVHDMLTKLFQKGQTVIVSHVCISLHNASSNLPGSMKGMLNQNTISEASIRHAQSRKLASCAGYNENV